ncbi:glycosyl transferase family 1 [Endozoicomonas sp. OPT23]|uniref:glycosyltransferase family 4 protein n=1 Tax=Endozoicomonas sp. OPT23 TaxID=2072845 RepID=UPI00129BBBFC|nr:glycosyltransferase family 4 protein [Endozoicomonas sp. OPT23]MRI34292.1 glycosyl transferase family 1 [Endozoicomonas sp. OPT23]
MRVAIIHDWLVTYAGAEKVLEQIISIFPDSDIFCLVDFIPDNQRFFLNNKKTKCSVIQKLPMAESKYRNYLPLFPLAIEQHDIGDYDLIISSSHCAAKGVLTGPDQLHISYCHSPVRYAWDLQHQYLNEANYTRGIKSWLIRYLLHRFRIWDNRTANGVDHFVANSNYIGRRIKKVYGRSATTIYPNVAIQDFDLCIEKEDYYLTCSRMVPYKKVDLIVKSFSEMPDKTLVVIGDGPDFDKIKKSAGSNIQLLGHRPFNELKDRMQRARAFVYAAEEDFGIVPVEAQACGTPVIAFGKGGLKETVVDGKTGLFFDNQTVSSLCDAIQRFENTTLLSPSLIREHASQFSTERFKHEFSAFVMSKWEEHQLTLNGSSNK